MKIRFIAMLIAVFVWLPLVQQNPVLHQMTTAQALYLVYTGQAQVVTLFEDGSAFIRYNSTVYGVCLYPTETTCTAD